MNLRELTIKEKVAGACPKCFGTQLHWCIVERDNGSYRMLVCASCNQLVSPAEADAHAAKMREIERSIRQRLKDWECYPKGSLCYDDNA